MRTEHSGSPLEVPEWPILLASGSPRRKELLEGLGMVFKVLPASVDEISSGIPEKVAIENAWIKAQEVAWENREYLVIGSDTVVAHEGEIFGKPEGEEHALEMLTALNGTTHEVISGVAVIGIHAEIEFAFSDTTRVEFKRVDECVLREYIKKARPFDKAGAYGIQDPEQDFISAINGSYDNVVGFPTELFIRKWNHYIPG